MISSPFTPAVFLTACIALLLTSDRVSCEPRFQVVRALTPRLAATLDEIYRVSPTARAIVDELEQSSVILHIHGMVPDQRQRFMGTMRLVHFGAGRRFLRITVNEWLDSNRRAAALVHELQHAVEVARADAVVNQASLGALYRRIGYESGGDANTDCYETAAALRVGRRVLQEVRIAGALARRGSGPAPARGPE
jgi:hypothetical protein